MDNGIVPDLRESSGVLDTLIEHERRHERMSILSSYGL